jgi:hypothetical protein
MARDDDRQPGPRQARPHDGAWLFALRFMLSSVWVGLAVAWLMRLPAFSWALWKLLFYFGATGVLSGLTFGMRNYRWLWRMREVSLRGRLAVIIHYCLIANGVMAVVIALTSGDRRTGLICGGSLAVMAVCSWVTVRWADR